MAAKMKVQELEDIILEQVKKLGSEMAEDNPEKLNAILEKSRCISELADSYVEINRMKLDVVKELNNGGTLYERYLGIESDSPVGKV